MVKISWWFTKGALGNQGYETWRYLRGFRKNILVAHGFRGYQRIF
jgi:hypothetical protein